MNGTGKRRKITRKPLSATSLSTVEPYNEITQYERRNSRGKLIWQKSNKDRKELAVCYPPRIVCTQTKTMKKKFKKRDADQMPPKDNRGKSTIIRKAIVG